MQDDVLKREAQGWVVRLTTGDATVDDVAALKQWSAQSPGHAKALAETSLLWGNLEDAAINLEAREKHKQAITVRVRSRLIGRRAFVTGAVAASAAAAVALAIKPPLDLWPAVADMMSDYRTRTGERQTIALAGDGSIEMTTRTSVNVQSSSSEGGRVALVSGEATFATPSKPIVVVAGNGAATASRAKFNVRLTDSKVRVTCLEGVVRVECGGRSESIGPGQQVVYSADAISQIAQVDPATITGWQRGLLVFRKVPLAQVVEEINRYRPGRIILSNDVLAARLVEATIRLDRIDDVIAVIRDAYGARVRSFPGGIVWLG